LQQKNTQKAIQPIHKPLKKHVQKPSLSPNEYEAIIDPLHFPNQITPPQKPHLIVQPVLQNIEVNQPIFAHFH
ncbi:hypothetical protein, partial [Priestia megaterium]|uniref:hypothetical protein n=1 Tax=Priestia megaterium TaxID=1404 RepID=UPI003709812E